MKKQFKFFALLACLSVGVVAGAAGASFVSADAESLVSQNMAMAKGASLYLNEVSGLKFQYTIANYDESANKNYGMLIVPYDYLAKAGITDLTDNTNDYVVELQEATLPNAPIVVENLQPNEEGKVEYSIGQLYENNYAREFFGIGFEKTDTGYVYATQNDNVRSVFEVANLALNKLNYGVWDETNEEEVKEKELLASNEENVLNPFITKALEFVYGTATPTVSLDAVVVGGEATPVITAEKVKNVDLAMHWNYVVADEGVASFENGKVKGEGRGQTTFTASLGKALSIETAVSVLKDSTELELYKNSGKADFFAVEDKISLTGGFFNTGSNNTEKVAAASVGYVAFEKEYTLDERGTYIDVYFQGNNMPSVEFFATEVNEKFMAGYSDDGKGFIVNNGMAYSSTNNDNSTAKFNGWAAYDGYFAYGVSGYNNRWNGPYAYQLGVQATNDAKVTVYDNTNAKDVTMSYSNFSMYSLARVQDANQNYRYTVGMYKDSDGYVWLDSQLYKVDDKGAETLFASFNGKAIVEGQTNSIKQEKLNEGETISGKIVLHAAVKGNVKGTSDPDVNVFSCSAPYAGEEPETPVVLPQHENATFNEDGTVSVKNGSLVSTNDFTKIGTTGYVVLDNDYQLGEYVDIYFTGSNMPNLSFLTKTVEQINANTAGFLLWRGTKWAADSSSYSWQSAGSFLVYSPNRSGTSQDKADMNSKSLGSSTSNASGAQSSGHPLSLYILENYEANTKFKMTIGFYKDSDGYVAMSVDVDTWDESNGTWVTYVAKAGKTSKAYSDFTLTSTIHADNNADKLGTYLIAYGGHDGTETTTFSYSAPYTK